jgi:homoserine O-acetyltransferase
MTIPSLKPFAPRRMRCWSWVCGLGLSAWLSLAGQLPAAWAEGEQQFADLGHCQLESGQAIENCRMGYRTFGSLHSDGGNTILFPTWYNGTSEDLKQFIGPNRLVDTTRYFVVAVDALGNGVSSSPSNSNPQKGTKFPAITIRDMVNAEYRLATEVLRVRQLYAVVGISMGGMQAFEWAVDYPDFVLKAIPIIGTPQQTSYDLLNWDLLRQAIEADPAYNHGDYSTQPPLRLANELATMTLPTPGFWARKISRADYQRWLKEIGQNSSLDANNRMWQLRAMMVHDVTHGQGGLAQAAAHVKAGFFIAVSAQDHLVNSAPALQWADWVHAPSFVSRNDCGHRMLLAECDGEAVSSAIREFLAGK